MKGIQLLLLALCCFASTNAQNYQPILTLEESGRATLIDNDPVMVVVENMADKPAHDLKEGVISECIGSYIFRMVISNEDDENKLPGLTIPNPDYNWTIDTYDRSGLPLLGFFLATCRRLIKKHNKFLNVFDISEVICANYSYIIAKGLSRLFVFHTQNIDIN